MPSAKGGQGAIVNIDQLLAPDITFVIGDGRWTIPGNISSRAVLTIQALTNAMQGAMEDGDMDATITAYEDMHNYLLPIFQERQPDMKELPWEFNTVLRVTGVILARALGADVHALAEAASDPPKTTSTPPIPNRSTRRAGSARSLTAGGKARTTGSTSRSAT